MLLKKGQARVDLPEIIETISARLYLYPDGEPSNNLRSAIYLLNHVSMTDMVIDGEKDVDGRPIMFAIARGPDRSVLRVHPKPDKDYEARFYYCPAQKEI